MRGAFLCLWLLVPAVVAAYHFGPGQDRLRLDDAADFLATADAQVDLKKYDAACESFDAALNRIPAANVATIRQVRLERAKAQMLASRLPEAYDELYSLGEELAEDEAAPSELVEETHDAIAGSQYYMTWLMRLEGRPRDDWEPVIEAARQNYRWLAERAEAQADVAGAEQHREDLEAAIRLARLDPEQLQALPIPTQCQKCNSGNCRCKGVGNRPKTGKPGGRGGSGGPPPDGSGA
jgi:tetratricopeptide (TPR) repeat protein